MRENLVDRGAEAWRPPIYDAGSGRRARWGFAVRRFFDLQAGSIWRDLSTVLPTLSGTVIDVGCGAQPYRPLVAPEARYVGVDTEDAARDFGYTVPGVRLFAGTRWPVDDGEADVVLSTETLEHVAAPEAFLEEAARSLRPGGRLVLTVPFSARWHYIPHDYWRFTPAALRMLLERAGFEDVTVWARGNALTVACYKVMALLLPLALPQREAGRVRPGIGTLLAAPLLVALAAAGTASLRGRGGDDCLGYTVLATRSVP